AFGVVDVLRDATQRVCDAGEAVLCVIDPARVLITRGVGRGDKRGLAIPCRWGGGGDVGNPIDDVALGVVDVLGDVAERIGGLGELVLRVVDHALMLVVCGV